MVHVTVLEKQKRYPYYLRRMREQNDSTMAVRGRRNQNLLNVMVVMVMMKQIMRIDYSPIAQVPIHR